MQRPRSQPPSLPYGPNRFWTRCGGVLGVILALAIVKHVALEQSLRGLGYDGGLINRAGLQLMLSQQVAKSALAIREAQRSDNEADRDAARQELSQTITFLEANRAAVQRREAEGLAGPPSDRVTERFEALESVLEDLVACARESAAHPSNSTPDRLLDEVARYGAAMDALVGDLALESRQRVQSTRKASRWGLVATVALGIVAAVFVLGPAIRESRQDKKAFKEALGRLELEQAAGDVLNDSLRGALALNRAVFSTAADSVIIFNRDGVIEQANASAAETFDIPEEQLVDMQLQDLMSEGYINIHDEYLQYASETTSDGVLLRNLSVRGKRADGGVFPAELSVSKVQAAGRTVLTGVLRDVTERVRLEDRLAQARKMESVGQLASGIAHEINTPMQFIATNISYLSRQLEGWIGFFNELRNVPQSELADNELDRRRLQLVDDVPKEIAMADVRGAIDDSLVGVDRVVEIISAMKDFAHPGCEAKGSVDLNHVIETAAVIARNKTKQVARVILDLDRRCEPFAGVVTGLNQTFVNLLVNAADAIEDVTKAHGGQGEIRISTKRADDGIEVLVSDTGCGMSEETAQQAFDPLYTTKDIGKGSGQGLTLAYTAVVEQHGGRIAIESAVGEGTTFRIFLPIEGPASDEAADESELVQAEA